MDATQIKTDVHFAIRRTLWTCSGPDGVTNDVKDRVKAELINLMNIGLIETLLNVQYRPYGIVLDFEFRTSVSGGPPFKYQNTNITVGWPKNKFASGVDDDFDRAMRGI